MLPSTSSAPNPPLPPLPAFLDRNHALLLVPRGEQWEVRMLYISPICLAPLFPSQQKAFAYGQTLVDRELSL